MTQYKIPVTWTMWGIHEIEADSLEEAVTIAKEEGIPLGDVTSDYYDIDIDAIESTNLKLKKKDKKWITDKYIERSTGM